MELRKKQYTRPEMDIQYLAYQTMLYSIVNDLFNYYKMFIKLRQCMSFRTNDLVDGLTTCLTAWHRQGMSFRTNGLEDGLTTCVTAWNRQGMSFITTIVYMEHGRQLSWWPDNFPWLHYTVSACLSERMIFWHTPQRFTQHRTNFLLIIYYLYYCTFTSAIHQNINRCNPSFTNLNSCV